MPLSQRFFASTRGRIVALLRKERRTVDELAQALDLTDNAIRAHLATLERDGVVRQREHGVAVANPPPSTMWLPKQSNFSQKHTMRCLSSYWRYSASTCPLMRWTLLREVDRRIAGRWNVPPGDLPMRLEAAVEILNELGGMAALEECDGPYCFRGYSCPLATVVLGHSEACHLSEALLTQVVEVPVQEQCDCSGMLQCCFTVASD
jgi:predicted ArsR family transcriptional regulator